MKHAGPKATASVTLTWQGRGLQLDIIDDGRGGAAADPPSAGGGGNGLLGMGERVSLYDGSLTAGPEQGGGFRVSAFIPYSEA